MPCTSRLVKLADLFDSCFFVKPGPQLAISWLWAYPWFLEIIFRKVCICFYIFLSFCTHMSIALNCKSSLYTRNKGYTKLVIHLHTGELWLKGGFLFPVQNWMCQLAIDFKSGFPSGLFWHSTSDSQIVSQSVSQQKNLLNKKFKKIHSKLMQRFRVDLKTFLGLAMPNQCFYAVRK